MTQYKTQYGTIFAVKEHNGAPAIMCRAEVSETWSLSSMITPFTPGAWTAEELQGQLDNWAATKGWQPVEAPASAEPPEIVDECSEPDEECPYLQPLENSKKYSCQCALCGDKFVNREICNKSFRGCGWYQDQQEKDARQDDEEEIPPTDFCQCRTCEHASCFAHGCTKECPTNAEESCLTTSCPEYSKETTPCNTEPNAPTGDAAATTDGRAAPEPSQAAETSTGSPGNSADASNCPSAEPAPQAPAALPLSAPDTAPTNLPAFDFASLDADTAEKLRGITDCVMELYQTYAWGMAYQVGRAHDLLCGDGTTCETDSLVNKNSTCETVSHVKRGRYSENTFSEWCRFIGIERRSAYNLLNAYRLICKATPEQQRNLQLAPAKLLYEAGKKDVPDQLADAVMNGDITKTKQFLDAKREWQAKLDAEHAAREQAEQQRDEAVTHIQAARDMQIDTARERDAALRRAAEAEKQRDGAREALTASKLRGDKLKAENEALKAQPVEAQVVDEEEVNRRAQARADELTAPLREELEALRARHPTDLEEAEQAIRDAYDSAIYTGRVMENAWHTLRPLLPRMDADRRELALNQIINIISSIQGECIACL